MNRSTIQEFVGSVLGYVQARAKTETKKAELEKLRRAAKYLKLALLSLND